MKLRPASISDSLAPALFVAAGFATFLVWDQWHWWGSKPDYMFGYIVPLFVAYVVFDRWPRIEQLRTAAPALALPLWLGRLLGWQAGIALLGGLALFALGAVTRAGAGASQPASLALAVGFSALLLGLVYLAAGEHAPATAAPPGPTHGPGGSVRALFAHPRVQLTGLFVFPAMVWMISAPLVSAVEGALSGFLLQKVTVVVFFVFDALGLLLERHGNVLVLPDGKGTVGVAEACSGIRSLTGSIFSGAFLAAVFLRSLRKKIALIAAALALAFFTNILRSLFLTAWAYTHGAAAIEGKIHDITGSSCTQRVGPPQALIATALRSARGCAPSLFKLGTLKTARVPRASTGRHGQRYLNTECDALRQKVRRNFRHVKETTFYGKWHTPSVK